MNRMLTLTTLAAALTAATAQAGAIRATGTDSPAAVSSFSTSIDGDRIRVESEQQFERDYGASAERIADGVYRMTEGPFAGKILSMGINGLRHDLAVLQQQLGKAGSREGERTELLGRIAELQKQVSEYETRELPPESAAKADAIRGISCWSYSYLQNRHVFYGGYAEVIVDGGLYLDNGGGGLNWYYARMSATAVANVYPPYGIYSNSWLSTSARVTDNLTGVTVNATPLNSPQTSGAGTGAVYSGPSFGHDLRGTATALASGDCWGYLSLTDQFLF